MKKIILLTLTLSLFVVACSMKVNTEHAAQTMGNLYKAWKAQSIDQELGLN